MTLTLLVDLDNTLLGNNMESFIPAYLGALGTYLSERVPPEKMVANMLNATQKMLANNDPLKTLKEVFDPWFYPPLGLDEVEMRALLAKFYAEHFPHLQNVTQYCPQAPDFVAVANRHGYRVGIATNPLFPLSAITQRLTWAGLSPEDTAFCLVPSYETFHFAKPNPAFFAEFMGQLGWPEGPVVMVGNDPDHDVRGASQMGIAVYWVSHPGEELPPETPEPQGSGPLEDVHPWLDSQPAEELTPQYDSQTAMIATLRGSPAAASTLLADLAEDGWLFKPEPEAWSVTEIACHLRDVEREVNLPRLKKIRQGDNPFIPGVDSDTWSAQRGYQEQGGPQALADFLAARCETLAVLESLTPEQWNLPCRHAIFGPTGLKEIVQFMAGHERLHGRQIYQNLKTL